MTAEVVERWRETAARRAVEDAEVRAMRENVRRDMSGRGKERGGAEMEMYMEKKRK
jgi:hypothetical protein